MDNTTRRRTADWGPFWLGVGLWLVVGVAAWTDAFTFIDEVGYVSQARMLLDGGVTPEPTSVGLWAWRGTEQVIKYPLFLPLLLMPLVAISPAVAFVIGPVVAILLAWLFARILYDWIEQPAWGLIVLAYPTVTLLAHTVMADLILCAAALGAWWALQRKSRGWAIGLFLLTVLAKPTGLPVAVALLLGDYFVHREDPGTRRPHLAALYGIFAGALVAAGLNGITTGTPWYGYHWAHEDKTAFAIRHLAGPGLTHLGTIVLAPPLLVAGALPLIRRKAGGLVAAAGANIALMACYFFVDAGRGFADSLVVAPRLILPAVVFLLLGYAEILAAAARRLRATSAMPWLLVVGTVAMSAAVDVALSRIHTPMREARIAAERLVDDLGEPLGLTYNSFKAGALSPRKQIFWVGPSGGVNPCVVLCNTASSSFRNAEQESCRYAGYAVASEVGTYRVLANERCR